MAVTARPLVWLHGEVKTPPFSVGARIEAGLLLWRLQVGEKLTLPHSRPIPVIGPRCHELRIQDQGVTRRVIEICRRRLWVYDARAGLAREGQ